MASNDELAQTATAPATPSTVAGAPSATLGRFRIKALLGEGGMGVVHAAFDPELERKIALKVLRNVGSIDAQARLLREARAMAKLSHPNVIGVFEVGSADGQDFVAMELIDGETLGAWLRRTRPDVRAILAAFGAAGHGLAAAHAVGLVHRDFKPSNVLRSHAGRIVVTDFGLARTEQSDEVPSTRASEPSTSGRTQTGALLGTPAYMAPEQWTAGTISAATDQFAFCVALWEALAGERPYRGTTHEELKSAVLAGPPAVADRIPRRLRPILRRGLAIDGAHRWSSMHALLDAIERATRRRGRWPVAAGGLGVAAVAVLAVLAVRASQAQTEDVCAAPVLDPARVWSADRAGAMALRDPETARLLASDVEAWTTLRSRACAAPPAQRVPTLTCLDAALGRLDDAVRSTLSRGGRIDADGLAAELVDPAMCDLPSPPRVAPITSELSLAFAWARYATATDSPLTANEVEAAGRVTSPCARAVRSIADSTLASFDSESLNDLATSCEDDRLRAAIALNNVTSDEDLEGAEAAVSRAPQPDLRAALEARRASFAAHRRRWDEATTRYTTALELYGVRRQSRAQVAIVLALSRVWIERGRPDDLRRFEELATQWLPRAHGTQRWDLAQLLQRVRWQRGELAAADAELERLGASPQPSALEFLAISPPEAMMGVTGVVVDAAGAPVADALVTSGSPLVGDSTTAATPHHTDRRRATRTGADGTFTLAFARGVIIAHAGPRRSLAHAVAPRVRLVLKPTSHLEGRVELGSTPASRVWVVAHPAHGGPADRAILVAPVREDGSFGLDGVPRGKLVIGAIEAGLIAVGGRPRHLLVTTDRLDGIELALTPPLHVIGRSSDLVAPEGAMIWVFTGFDPGPHPSLETLMSRMVAPDTVRSAYARKVDLASAPDAVAGKVQADDMIARVSDPPNGPLLVCAMGLARKQFARGALHQLGTAFTKQEVACTRVEAAQSVVTIALPPLRKLDPTPPR